MSDRGRVSHGLVIFTGHGERAKGAQKRTQNDVGRKPV